MALHADARQITIRDSDVAAPLKRGHNAHKSALADDDDPRQRCRGPIEAHDEQEPSACATTIRDSDVAAPLKLAVSWPVAGPWASIRDSDVAAPLKPDICEQPHREMGPIRDSDVAAPLKQVPGD